MAPLVILTAEQGSGEVVVARRARLHERLAARWRASSLDAELARGVAPEARAALALRAHALGEPGVRKLLARQVRRVLDEARSAQRSSCARIPIRTDEVLAAAAELDELATRLISPGLLASSGLASVRLLLSDGCSPLYFRGAAEELRAAVSGALEAIEPRIEW
jgi:hypothetical protein